MSPETIGLLGLGLLLLLLAVRVPIAVALGTSALIGMHQILGWDATVSAAARLTFTFLASWELSAVPLFILMGVLCAESGLVHGIYEAARVWLSRLPGGLAIATNFASAGFAAASGSSLATAATMSKLAIPEMLRAGYQPGLAGAVVAASGTLGALIPPSILLIVYGLVAEQPIGLLLLAGIAPGLLTAFMYALLIVFRCSMNRELAPRQVRDADLSFAARLATLKNAWPLPVLIVAVIGSIYSGVATATESAAYGCVAAAILCYMRGQLTAANIINVLRETLSTTGLIFFIVFGAVLFTKFLALAGLPAFLAERAGIFIESPDTLIVVIIVTYLILGIFLDSLGLMLLTLPVFLPLVQGAGFNSIWFGVFVVKLVEIGVMTPPVGLNAFVVKASVGDAMSLSEIFKGLTWFLAAEAVVVVLLWKIPSITLWIPMLSVR